MSIAIEKYLTVERVVHDLVAPTKHDALRSMLAVLPDGVIERAEALRALLEREALGSTGIGEGVAIPHGRVSTIHSEAVVVYARCPAGLDFQAVDGKPVDLLFLILVAHQSATHMKLLGRISRMVQRPDVRAALREADSAEAAHRILVQEELPA